MTRDRFTDVATGGLGVLYIVDGIAETIRAVSTGDGGIPFWFGTLVGGGTLILIGFLGFRHRLPVYGVLVVLGCVLGILATAWTLIVPVLALAVVFLTLQRISEETETAG